MPPLESRCASLPYFLTAAVWVMWAARGMLAASYMRVTAEEPRWCRRGTRSGREATPPSARAWNRASRCECAEAIWCSESECGQSCGTVALLTEVASQKLAM
jgi:hypothetical protein